MTKFPDFFTGLIIFTHYLVGNVKLFTIQADSTNRTQPYFGTNDIRNFTTTVGHTAYLHCDVQQLGDKATTMLLSAFKERGLVELDYNGRSPYGVSRIQNFLDRNIRSGTAHAYIRPAANRSNLVISDNSLVTKVIIANDRAVGVEFVKNGTLYSAHASKEVILSAGAINTPQILMLSGVGPSQELKKHGIKLVKDLPVGKNLQDQVAGYPIFFRTNHTYYNLTLKEQLKLWYENKRPLTGGGKQVILFRNLKNNTNSSPDIEFIVTGTSSRIAINNRFNKEYTAAYQVLNEYTDFAFQIFLLHPESKGKLTLQSKNPRDYPLIDFNFFAVEKDLETLYQSIKWLLEIQNTKSFKNFKAERLFVAMPGCDENYKIDSRYWWYCVLNHVANPVSWIRNRDLHILTVGVQTYTSDQRFQVIRSEKSSNWTLQIKFPQLRDSGIYECQVNTEPKMSLPFRLNVIEAKAIILGSSDLHVREGSSVTLTCTMSQGPHDLSSVFWYKEDKIVQPTENNEIQRITIKNSWTDVLSSQLHITSVNSSDSGKYACDPTSGSPAYANLYVITGEHPAAMHHGNRNCSPTPFVEMNIATTLAIFIFSRLGR